MLNRNDVKIIIDDILGSIILIVEEENEMIINIPNFLNDNFDLITKGNLINSTFEEVQKVELSIILDMLVAEGFKIDIIDNNNYRFNVLNTINFDSKEYINRNLVIYK